MSSGDRACWNTSLSFKPVDSNAPNPKRTTGSKLDWQGAAGAAQARTPATFSRTHGILFEQGTETTTTTAAVERPQANRTPPFGIKIAIATRIGPSLNKHLKSKIKNNSSPHPTFLSPTLHHLGYKKRSIDGSIDTRERAQIGIPDRLTTGSVSSKVTRGSW